MQLPLVGLAEDQNQKPNKRHRGQTVLSVEDLRKRNAQKMRNWRLKNREYVRAKYGSEYWKKYNAEHRATRLASRVKYAQKNRAKHHIKPFTAFDLSDPEQQKAAMHWTNLRPEWPRPNLQKHSHWNGRCWRHKDHVPKLIS